MDSIRTQFCLETDAICLLEYVHGNSVAPYIVTRNEGNQYITKKFDTLEDAEDYFELVTKNYK